MYLYYIYLKYFFSDFIIASMEWNSIREEMPKRNLISGAFLLFEFNKNVDEGFLLLKIK